MGNNTVTTTPILSPPQKKIKALKTQGIRGRKALKTPEWIKKKKNGKTNLLAVASWLLLFSNNFLFLLYFNIACQRTNAIPPVAVDNT